MVSERAVQVPVDNWRDRVGRIERVPYVFRWFQDAFELFHCPGGFGLTQVDMTQTNKAVRILRDAKIPATYPHLIVRAVALAWARYPGARYVCGYKCLTPAALDVGLSMAGLTAYAPVVVIPAVDQKPLAALIPAAIDAVDDAAMKETRDLISLSKVAIPFRWLRRWILKILHRNMAWRIRVVGHFQVTCLTNVDVVVPLLFYSNAILGVGAVRDRVVAIDGQAVVRPTVWLSGVADHAVSDGQRGGDTLQAIKEILEGDELVREARDAAALRAEKKAHEQLLGPDGTLQPARPQ
jgi:2-oxoacid dehydrogenases acyltransferase (catalytic domain)